ncbi:MAG: tRNA lysidine(34) synthetase TilS [Lentisphaeria bacterium]|nr:tRNA lysidine(34) synthetase TilS [Lentisphaeria bacterium]
MAEKNSKRLLLPEEFAPFAEKVKGKVLYCSFSGGADSLALLYFLSFWWAKKLFLLKCVHFEHGFRGEESLKDAEYCRKKCEEKNIPFQCVFLNVPENRLPGEGDEEAARRCRLNAWKKIITDPEKEYIVTGHHNGDVVENMFLRLFRGTNSSGITSLRAFSKVNGLTFFRPLLDFTKKELEEFLLSCNENSWCVDSTNKENDYRRNFIRNILLPQIYQNFPFAEKGMLAASKSLLCDASYIEEMAAECFEKFRKSGYEINGLYLLHDALLIRLLRYFLREKCNREVIPDGALLQRVKESLVRYRKNLAEKNGESISIPVSGLENTFLVISMGKLFLMEKKELPEKILLCDLEMLDEKKVLYTEEESFSLKIEKTECTAMEKDAFLFDVNGLSFPLYYAFWQGGEKMIPFGRTKEVNVKKLFSDAKIPALKRGEYPLILDAENNILCAGKLRRSALAPVSEKTENILKIVFL